MNIESFEGFIDFLTLFNTAELFNVMDTRSYRNKVPLRDRLSFIEARRLCRTILAWFSSRYEILTSEGQTASPAELQESYFRGQVRALLRYKSLEEEDLKLAEREEAEAFPEDANDLVQDPSFAHIGFEDMRGMIERGIDGGVELVKEFQRFSVENPSDYYFTSLAWPSSEKYEVRGKSCPEGRFISFILGSDGLTWYSRLASQRRGIHLDIHGLTPLDEEDDEVVSSNFIR